MIHYLITKFNVTHDGWTHDKNGEKVLTKAWTDDRILRFEQDCLPSVMDQSNKNFQWLVLFGQYLKQIPRWASMCDQFTPVMVDDWRDALPRGKWAITSRLDNDDVIHPDYIKTLQLFAARRERFLNYIWGYQRIANELIKVEDTANSFCSLVSKRNNICDYTHGNGILQSGIPIRQLTGQRYWIQVIHERNKSNGLR